MAEATKSVLFVDYDSIHRSLVSVDDAAADRFASRVAEWVAAIESGKIFARNSGGGRRRRILMRRCYADPALLGDERSSFLSNGFQVVDCPPADGHERNAAAIHMVLDTIDALEHPADYDEFILLSAETDLSPVLIRLRAHNRATAIYAKPATAESYKAIVDAMIDEERLFSFVMSDETAAAESPAAQSAEISEVEALARKVATATNVPLFAPRTFAELFRHLVDEISENGYHFQSTAENVATRMAEAGRNVTRRQVVFVVKGLALKGHVFSTSDTPERLAEVFREQVLYLTENAGLDLSKHEKTVLASWIVGRVAAGSSNASEDVEIAATADADTAEEQSPKPTAKSGRQSRSSRRKQTKAAEPSKTETAAPASPSRQAAPAPEAAKPKSEPDEDVERPAPPAARPSTSPEFKPAAAPPLAAPPAARPPAPLARPISPPARTPSVTVRSPLGMRSASQLPGSPGARPAATSPMRIPPVSRPVTRTLSSDADKEKVESSILAAIAQAVDVLVDDGSAKSRGGSRSNVPPDTTAESQEAAPERRPPQEANEASEGDDIGDEIQRIIASYNRKRDRDG
jgi:hypothetical protein